MAIRCQGLHLVRALNKELRPSATAVLACREFLAFKHHQKWHHRSIATLVNNNNLLDYASTASSYDNCLWLRNMSSTPKNDNKHAFDSEIPSTNNNNNIDVTSEDEDSAGAMAANDNIDEGGMKIAQLESQIKELKDNLLRSLAEQENTRRIAARDVANAKSYAISSFAKSLLDTSDNLSRALESVPIELRHDHESNPVLATLYEGISMTDDGLNKAFAKNGLVKFGARGEKFDPNLHEALFEYPDPECEAGHIGQVMKVGFTLNSRVLRPAEVGVVKA